MSAALLFPTAPCAAQSPLSPTLLQVVDGTTVNGAATGQWLAMLRQRLSPDRYDSVAPMRKPWTPAETAWAGLIRSRVGAWRQAVPDLARLFTPIPPPENVEIVLGNRGAEDAFTHDARTIGFDLAALQANYGAATLQANRERVDRFFRHEFIHLLQKAWLVRRPWGTETPLRAALADIWAEGLGNYQSLSPRWLSRDGQRSEVARRALARLEPRFVARLGALACASPDAAEPLLADLSFGPFTQKWGALTAALWLEAEPGGADEALRRLIVGGPGAVWDLADRHLPEALRPVLREVREAAARCAAR